MQNRTLFPKRIIKKISLSAAAIAMGLFLYAGVASNAQEASGPCMPGAKDWPQCLDEEAAQLQAENFIKE